MKKPDIKIDGYNSQAAPVDPPNGAIFNKGDRSVAEIQRTADRRREHSNHLSHLPRTPKQSRDS